jgi:hypothetical protein
MKSLPLVVLKPDPSYGRGRDYYDSCGVFDACGVCSRYCDCSRCCVGCSNSCYDVFGDDVHSVPKRPQPV